MSNNQAAETRSLDPGKFRDPDVTAKGEKRAVVALTRLGTVWFNTGSLCNLSCHGCYMESGPTNDRLVYLTADEVAGYLDEIVAETLPVDEIGFTGGEPFMNKQFLPMLADTLDRGFRALVLTNAMEPFWRRRNALVDLKGRYGNHLTFRVSIDHHTRAKHELTRGERSWDRVLDSVKWLAENEFQLSIAGRTCWSEDEDATRKGYADLFARIGILIDAHDPERLVLFPEMDETVDVPEITTNCWDILGVAPDSMMCATQRMVIKRKGAEHPVVVPCTLLPYDPRFELGHDLVDSAQAVKLNHPHCATFCVLGGGACSAG